MEELYFSEYPALKKSWLVFPLLITQKEKKKLDKLVDAEVDSILR